MLQGDGARGFSKQVLAKQPKTKPGTPAGCIATELLERRTLMSVFTPAQIRQAYGVEGMDFASTAAYGQGQTIAIIIPWDDPTDIADANAFSSMFSTASDPLPQFNDGLTANGIADPTLTVVGSGGGPRPSNVGATNLAGWQTEQSLDIEWAHVMAPFANIVVVEASSSADQNLLAANVTAASYNGTGGDVSVISNSWSEAEPMASAESMDDGSFAMPASPHQAVAFLASAGDHGATDTSTGVASTGYPSMSPDVISVGGTSLPTNSDGTYGGESAWSYSKTTRTASSAATTPPSRSRSTTTG
jgi:subtilase family serine protease